MKIRTMTCHHVYNYGASLQAFALQHYLESIGHDVKIIDYRLPCHVRYEFFTPRPGSKCAKIVSKYPYLKYLLSPIANRGDLKMWGRKKAFDFFDKKYLHLTSRYKTKEQLVSHPPHADVYIVGSDQVWNPTYPYWNDLGYFLSFGDKSVKRISYAASFGVASIPDSKNDYYKEQLSIFDRLSVREQSGVSIINHLGLSAIQCIDPVFLLSEKEWIDTLGLKKQKRNYILVYDFLHNDSRMMDYVVRLSKETGLKIVSVNDYSDTPYADEQINDAGPIDFLTLILNAEYVICNSFHATVFSIIFRKRFVTFPLVGHSNSSRMKDILNMLSLDDLFNPSDLSYIRKTVDYDNIMVIMQSMIDKSKKYLNESL